LPQASAPALSSISGPYRRRVRHPAIVTFAGFAVLIASVQFGPAALFFIGIPTVLIACGVAGGARFTNKNSAQRCHPLRCDIRSDCHRTNRICGL
jgi:hypothetical protein